MAMQLINVSSAFSVPDIVLCASEGEVNKSSDSVYRYRDRNQSIHGHLCGDPQEVCLLTVKCCCSCVTFVRSRIGAVRHQE